MNEVIKYFESLEARIAALEEAVEKVNRAAIAKEDELTHTREQLHAIEGHVKEMLIGINELRNRPQPEAASVAAPVEAQVSEPEPEIPEEPVIEEQKAEEPQVDAIEETSEEPAVEPKEEPTSAPAEDPSPKAAIYGKAVDDIRQAISLGDRFLYQRELFGQNAELMQRTLTELDTLLSYDEAINYIESHFDWDQESSTYQQFLITLHRRFG